MHKTILAERYALKYHFIPIVVNIQEFSFQLQCDGRIYWQRHCSAVSLCLEVWLLSWYIWNTSVSGKRSTHAWWSKLHSNPMGKLYYFSHQWNSIAWTTDVQYFDMIATLFVRLFIQYPHFQLNLQYICESRWDTFGMARASVKPGFRPRIYQALDCEPGSDKRPPVDTNLHCKYSRNRVWKLSALDYEFSAHAWVGLSRPRKQCMSASKGSALAMQLLAAIVVALLLERSTAQTPIPSRPQGKLTTVACAMSKG